jgi:hypothetical protein
MSAAVLQQAAVRRVAVREKIEKQVSPPPRRLGEVRSASLDPSGRALRVMPSRVYSFFYEAEPLKVFRICCIDAGDSVLLHGGRYLAIGIFNLRVF